MDRSELRDFLEIPYDKLEELNLEAKHQRVTRMPVHEVRELRERYLTDEKRIKAVTVAFSDLEGRRRPLNATVVSDLFTLKKKDPQAAIFFETAEVSASPDVRLASPSHPIGYRPSLQHR